MDCLDPLQSAKFVRRGMLPKGVFLVSEGRVLFLHKPRSGGTKRGLEERGKRLIARLKAGAALCKARPGEEREPSGVCK